MSTQDLNSASTASKRDLLRGMLIAASVAAAILVAAVLPAEYGIDPTGIGKALGLTKLSGNITPAVAPAQPAAVDTPTIIAAAPPPTTLTSKQVVAYRAETREVPLQAGQGLEIKMQMDKGAALIYSWKTKNGAKISHDFHGDPVNAKNDEFESYIEEKNISESKGSLIAPFTGKHGWWWNNETSAPVTVILQVSGFYTNIVNQ